MDRGYQDDSISISCLVITTFVLKKNLIWENQKNIIIWKVKGGKSFLKKRMHIYSVYYHIARAFWKMLLKMKMLQYTLYAKIKTIQRIEIYSDAKINTFTAMGAIYALKRQGRILYGWWIRFF